MLHGGLSDESTMLGAVKALAANALSCFNPSDHDDDAGDTEAIAPARPASCSHWSPRATDAYLRGPRCNKGVSLAASQKRYAFLAAPRS